MSIWRAHRSSTIRARKALQTGGSTAFVDNVDTRARRKIHVALSFCYIYRLEGSFAHWAEATTVAIDNIDKTVSAPKQEPCTKIKNLVFSHLARPQKSCLIFLPPSPFRFPKIFSDFFQPQESCLIFLPPGPESDSTCTRSLEFLILNHPVLEPTQITKFDLAGWIGKEVTGDPRYRKINMETQH